MKMRAKNDPTALALAAEYPAVRMPAVGVAPADAVDLISYLILARHARARICRVLLGTGMSFYWTEFCFEQNL